MFDDISPEILASVKAIRETIISSMAACRTASDRKAHRLVAETLYEIIYAIEFRLEAAAELEATGGRIDWASLKQPDDPASELWYQEALQLLDAGID